MKILRLLFRTARRSVLAAAASAVAAGVTTTLLLASVNRAFVVGFHGSAALAFVCSMLGTIAASLVAQLLLARLAMRTEYELRMALCGRIASAPLRQIEEVGPSRLLEALTEDVPVLVRYMSMLPAHLANVVMIGASMLYLAALAWVPFLCCFGILAVGLVTAARLTVLVDRYNRGAREAVGELHVLFHNLADGAKELRLNQTRQSSLWVLLDRAALSAGRHGRAIAMMTTAGSNWVKLLYFGAVAAVLAFPAIFTDFPARSAHAFVVVLMFVWAPIESAVAFVAHSTRAEIAFAKFDGLSLQIAEVGAPHEPPSAAPGSPLRAISMAGVRYAFSKEGNERPFELGPLDFSIGPGRVVFVIGGNGSGKSTFTKLFAGLYVPQSGTIIWNGSPVVDENRQKYRQNFSAVFADYCLLDRVPLSGEFGRPAAEWLHELRLQSKVSLENGRFSTTTALSHGQRRRLALLAALLEDRPVYVFDEWAADQDPQFKQWFYATLVPHLKSQGKAVLAVTHDDRYFHLADEVLKLEYGRASEGGTGQFVRRVSGEAST